MEIRSRNDGALRCSVEPTSPAVLSLAFGPGIIVLSEMSKAKTALDSDGHFYVTGDFEPPDGGAITMIDVERGEVSWRTHVGRGRHCIEIIYAEAMQRIFGVVRTDITGCAEFVLIALDPHCGRIIAEHPLSADTCWAFALRGSVLITGSGMCYAVREGGPEALGRLSVGDEIH